MKLSQKVSYALASMLGVLVITVMIGFYSTVSLSSLLNFITTSAWDTADGAMEGSIGIEAQMIAVERLTSGKSQSNKALLEEGEELAKEALDRMIDAGLMTQEEINKLNEKRDAFNTHKTELLSTYNSYTNQAMMLDSAFANMKKAMTTAEELGDAEVEELERNPNMSLSWNGGLKQKWQAADGMMEAQIFFLSVNYYFKNFIESYAKPAIETKVNEYLGELRSLLNEVSTLKVFQRNKINNTPISDLLQKQYNELDTKLTSTMNSYKAYLNALNAYTESSNALLGVIEAIEESADAKVEGQASAVSSTQTLAYTLCTLALIAGLVLTFIGRRIFSLNIINPIELLTRNMKAVAEDSPPEPNDFIQRTDEIGDIAKALEVFIGLFNENKRISNEAKRLNSAIEAANTNIMMADAHYNIVYMNPAVKQMMKIAETDLQKELPNFDANNLLGQNIDIFHKNPAHQRGMLEKLQQTYRTEITVGSRTFGLIATPIFNEEKMRLGTVVEWNDRTEALKHEHEKELQQQEMAQVARETKRIKDALDACSTNVMMADADYNIVYMNPAVQNMMAIAESDLKKELPNFNAKDLIGKNIDVFHKNPAHQRTMLARLQDVYKTTIQVGTRTFGLIATPIFDERKQRLGTVVEWADKTAEVLIEKEVASLIKAANEGNLSKRLDSDGQPGFIKIVSEGLNSLMDTTSKFVADVGVIFEAMAEGNLTKTIQNDYQGELLKIKDNANNSIAKLSDVLSKIQSASDIVRTSSNEVAQGSDDLSRRTESQASSLEETAASMEEITATVKQTAESATQSNSLASEAKIKAQKGGDVVQGAVQAMGEIMAASTKINDIIGVIDEIAFQTNLLALNAAVEAARAGEQGRGFAVVAGEVRTLSQRSAAAAKEIKDLIRDSVNKVESGSSLVNQSGQMLADIVQAVDKVARMIADVNTAAIEQNSGISQINQAITQMDEMTQQNAALVEETSAASRSMSEEANTMSRLISFFQLSRNGGSVGSPANTTAEPIRSYQPSTPKPAPKASSTPNANGGNASGSKGAASFSSDDEWEDF